MPKICGAMAVLAAIFSLVLHGVVASQGCQLYASVAFLSPQRSNGDVRPCLVTKSNGWNRPSEEHGNGYWPRPGITRTSCFYASPDRIHDESQESIPPNGIRLNKVFKATHSRREADALIESGRVSVNGQTVIQKGGFLVQPFVDQIALDGVVMEGWEAMNGYKSNVSIPARDSRSKPDATSHTHYNNDFEYIKYWKPRGVTCTTDPSIDSNIIDDLTRRRGYQPKHRVYPVGRLDKDSTGLILLTSDGRLPNSALRGMFKRPKVYQVLVDRAIREVDIERLRRGVVITTVAQRDGKNRGKALTAPTLPCEVERIPGSQQRGVTMTLVEGRNRQIRRMMQALSYEVVELHRIQFMGITLGPLQRAGEWKTLDEEEMALVHRVLQQAATQVLNEPH